MKDYKITSRVSRGPAKRNLERNTRYLTFDFSYEDWCKLKMLSLDTGRPMKYILIDCLYQVHGRGTKEDVERFEGKAKPPMNPAYKGLCDPFTGLPIEGAVEQVRELPQPATPPAHTATLLESVANPVAAKFFKKST